MTSFHHVSLLIWQRVSPVDYTAPITRDKFAPRLLIDMAVPYPPHYTATVKFIVYCYCFVDMALFGIIIVHRDHLRSRHTHDPQLAGTDVPICAVPWRLVLMIREATLGACLPAGL